MKMVVTLQVDLEFDGPVDADLIRKLVEQQLVLSFDEEVTVRLCE